MRHGPISPLEILMIKAGATLQTVTPILISIYYRKSGFILDSR